MKLAILILATAIGLPALAQAQGAVVTRTERATSGYAHTGPAEERHVVVRHAPVRHVRHVRHRRHHPTHVAHAVTTTRVTPRGHEVTTTTVVRR